MLQQPLWFPVHRQNNRWCRGNKRAESCSTSESVQEGKPWSGRRSGNWYVSVCTWSRSYSQICMGQVSAPLCASASQHGQCLLRRLTSSCSSSLTTVLPAFDHLLLCEAHCLSKTAISCWHPGIRWGRIKTVLLSHCGLNCHWNNK